jgi:tRNA (guanine37-N1)-methyltransferase
MQILIITLFPEMFYGILNSSILKRAQDKGKVKIEMINLKDFGIGKHRSVDDKPYGGGAGMLLKVDVLHNAIKFAKNLNKKTKIILLDPSGKKYNQEVAENLSKKKSITLICGHYEGFDARVKDYVDMQVSMGDFVLTGGEIPAMAIADSIIRLIPGVLGKDESSHNESFSLIEGKRTLEHDQFTRPEVYDKKKVPGTLLSGDPKIVDLERNSNSLKKTEKVRPDLLT